MTRELEGRDVLPEALGRLLAAEGLEPVEVAEISSLAARGGARRTFRIELADGRVVKGRTLLRAATVDRMRRWLPLLPPGRFTTLLAALDTVTLETWCEGSPCDPDAPAAAEAAGRLLGAVHAVLPPERRAHGDPGPEPRELDVEGWIEDLARAGHLSAPRASRAADAVRESRPDRATWGLRHGDLCAENLVVADDGLRCVDNTTVGPGILELDVAQSAYRWPMAPSTRARFLAGYDAVAPAAREPRADRFWAIAAALRAAAFRARHGTAGVDVPLRELARHVA